MNKKRFVMYAEDDTQYTQLRIILLKQGIKVSEWLRRKVAEYISDHKEIS